MPVNCIIEDIATGQRHTIFFLDEELEEVRKTFDEEDPLLLSLSSMHKEFIHITRRSQLLNRHWCFFLSSNLQKYTKMDKKDQYNQHSIITKSLHYNLKGLAIFLSDKTESLIDLIKIQYFPDSNVHVTFMATINFEKAIKPLKQPKLQIVVDNTDGH